MQLPKKKKSSDYQEEHSQKAYRGIRRLLYFKEIVPGQKISCRDLSERLSMSLTPVIQALKLMEFQGFVHHKPNRGYFVTPFSLKEVEEIYRLRELLEPSLIPETIKNLKETGKKQLQEALNAHSFLSWETHLIKRLLKNMEFHLTLAHLSENETQERILRRIFDIMLLKYGGNYLPAAYNESGNKEHQKIFDCVVSGDIKGAQSTLLAHIARVKYQMLESFKRIQDAKELTEF